MSESEFFPPSLLSGEGPEVRRERCPGEVEKPANFAETGLGKK
jgi:hypothetical protein